MKRLIGFTLGFIYLCVAVASQAALFDLPDFSELVKKNGAAVVNISTTQKVKRSPFPQGIQIPDLPKNSPFRDFFRHYFDNTPEQYNVQSLGSGFIISTDGYILTSAHVINNASKIIVRLTNREEYEAKIVGADKRSDVAVLKIDAKSLPILKIGDPSKLQVGEWVLAIGSPFGFNNSATAGIVSAKGRSLPNETYVPFIQTDVAINPGNSGGPLFNLEGQVVGINAQIYSRTGGFMGLSFAVPIDLAMRVADQLKEHGQVTRGWLGVTIQNVTRELAKSFGMDKPRGALVAAILEDSPASKSSLVVGDVIVDFDGQPVRESSDLPPLVGRATVGVKSNITVIRNGKTKLLSVVIGKLPKTEELESRVLSPASGEKALMGMRVRELTKKEMKERGVDHGLLVVVVNPGPARQADIRPQDIILQIDRKRMASKREFSKIIKAVKPGSTLAVLVKRQEGSMFLVLKVPEDP
ncbi:MAG TPA: DegQ family serine endoprotease [Acidiferrobacteraceae bacterium]|nr:DegQ family serine endoprotease [Acidiferrobacteraceae bacterium]